MRPPYQNVYLIFISLTRGGVTAFNIEKEETPQRNARLLIIQQQRDRLFA